MSCTLTRTNIWVAIFWSKVCATVLVILLQTLIVKQNSPCFWSCPCYDSSYQLERKPMVFPHSFHLATELPILLHLWVGRKAETFPWNTITPTCGCTQNNRGDYTSIAVNVSGSRRPQSSNHFQPNSCASLCSTLVVACLRPLI